MNMCTYCYEQHICVCCVGLHFKRTFCYSHFTCSIATRPQARKFWVQIRPALAWGGTTLHTLNKLK